MSAFIESVKADMGAEVLDEIERMVPKSTAQRKAEKDRPTALKKAMAAIERGFQRHEKKRGVAAHRKAMSDIQKEMGKHDKDDPDAVKKALKGLRDMRTKRGGDDKKGDSKKAKSRDAGGGAASAKGGGAAAGGGGGGGQDRAKQKGAAGSGSRGQHHPFKKSPNLGKGPGTPPGFPKVYGKKNHNQAKCWNCSCGPIYTKGCICTGTGKDKSCPKGAKKKVKIRKDYRDAYNKMYHAWRAQKGGAVTARLKGGGRPGAF